MSIKKNIIASDFYQEILNALPKNNPASKVSADSEITSVQPLTHISMCSGYGGIDIGLSKILKNLKTIAYCEQDAIRISNLVSKMEQGWLEPAPIWTNLEDFPIDNFVGNVDVISGGIPCQPFSVAGKREAEKSEKFLFPKFSMMVQKSKPKFFMIENVDGLRGVRFQDYSTEYINKHNTSYVLLYMLRDLEEIGYRVHFRLETATRAGLPQERKRIFIVGVRDDLNEEELSDYFVDTSYLSIERSPHHKSHYQYLWESPRLMEKKPK
jgi:DNA (cytosine-5)-methyltransferase 1